MGASVIMNQRRQSPDKGRGSGVREEVTEKDSRDLTEAKSSRLLRSSEDKTIELLG